MTSDFLDIFGGESEAVPEGSSENNVDLMYKPAEAVFSATASTLVEKGWSVFPQDQQRRPGRVNGETIAWSREHRLPYQLPTKEALEEWKLQCSTHNVAVALGQGSGYTFALDIDVLDKVMSEKITALADEMLGVTPLVRVGKAPKIALFYRYTPDDPVSNVSRVFAETDEKNEVIPSEHAIEILTEGKPITLLGMHHTTGRYFQWLRESPLDIGPEEAPIVSSDQLASFMEAVDENIQRFYRNPTVYMQPDEIEWDESKGLSIPKLRTVAGGTAWTEDRTGKVSDGREAYMTKLVYSFVRLNRGMPPNQLIRHIYDQFMNDILNDGKWNSGKVTRDITDKVNRLLEKVQAGEVQFSTPRPVLKSSPDSDGTADDRLIIPGKFKMPYSKEQLAQRGLGFLPSVERRRELPGQIVETNDPIVLTPEDRQTQIDSIGTGLINALDEFFEDVFMANGGRTPGENRVHVIKAPTGAGKTSRTIHYIGQKKDEHAVRTSAMRIDGSRDEDGAIVHKAQGLDLDYEDDFGNLKSGTMPIVFLLPTYANIEEVRIRAEVLNLDASLSDDELKKAASDKGLFPEEEMDSRLGDMKREAMNAGLNVLVYKGKIAAGCQMAEKVKAAMSAGIGSSAFCKADVKRDDETTETVYCPHYQGCPAILQKDKIQEADLIFTPHPFMQLNIPKELKHARAVIADERIHHLFLHTAEFPLFHLSLPRKSVKLNKEDRDRGVTADDYVQDRDEAVNIISAALRASKCPAEALFNYMGERDGESIRRGPLLVQSCLRICTNALKKDVTLNPEMDIEEVLELCDQPTGIHIREERRFWQIMEQRIAQLTNKSMREAMKANSQKIIDTLAQPGEAAARIRQQETFDELSEVLDGLVPFPKGEKDLRVQFIREHVAPNHVRELVRISWRTTPNWEGIPLLLLDASAAPEIIHKIWNGADVKAHDITGPLHMRVVGVVNRTFSNSSVVGDPKDNDAKELVTAKGLAKLRTAISTVSSWFGDSRLVAGSSILVRRTINTDWAGPDNVDWCHFGAMRGLDFAKFHDAAFSIGRMELPIRTIDGLVAALTYDDDEPELPFDINGTGMKNNHPLLMPSKMQRLKMRSGEVVEIPTPMHPGKWGRLIQKQYREEELLQFCGRLRPVYREGEAPVWFALSSVIPENLIIDDLVHLDDLVQKRSYFWEAVRKAKGVIHPQVLLNTSPDLFKDRAEVVKLMNEFGFSYTTGEQTGVQSKGYTAYTIHSDRPQSTAFVMTSLVDRETLLQESLTEAEISFDRLELRNPENEVKSLARRRDKDTVEVELGEISDRAEMEKSTSDKATVRLFSKGVRRVDRLIKTIPSHPVTFAAGNDDVLKNLYIRFSDAEAHETLNRLWQKMSYEKELAQKNPLMQDEQASYEKLGNHVSDQDAA